MLRRLLPALLSLAFAVSAVAHEPVFARHGMVVAQEDNAADVGVAVLKSGGNAVDAAVAVGFALAVTHPFAGNLGGGGFMLIRLADGRTTFIDFREKAPAKASHNMYLDASGKATRDSIDGWRSSGVPGTVRGLELAHQKYGHRPWAELLEPAVDLASNGFRISHWQSESFRHAKRFAQYPTPSASSSTAARPTKWATSYVQPELAQTLSASPVSAPRNSMKAKPRACSPTAMAQNGGLITLDDLQRYQAVERALEGAYRGYQIVASPPPSSGGVGILQMLDTLDGTGFEKTGAGAADITTSPKPCAATMPTAIPTWAIPTSSRDPIAGLLDPAYIAKRRGTIQPGRATPSDKSAPACPPARGDQDHPLQHRGRQGNAVA